MANVVALNGQNAKSASGKSFTGRAKTFPISEAIANAIKGLWPRKTAQHVSFVTGCDERTVKFWLAGETRMSVESVSKLLATDDGFAILTAIMGDAEPEWWELAKLSHRTSQNNKAIRKAERETARLRAQIEMKLFKDL